VVAPEATLAARPFRLVWRSHWIVKGGGRSACLACGRAATARPRISLEASACLGMSEAPSAALTGPLLAGIFDAALDRAPPAWSARAGALQRRSLPTRSFVVGNLVRFDPAARPSARLNRLDRGQLGARVGSGGSRIKSVCVCVCVYACVRVCVCVCDVYGCVCLFVHMQTCRSIDLYVCTCMHTHTYTHKRARAHTSHQSASETRTQTLTRVHTHAHREEIT
jgi:hypothetical protein